MGLLKLNAVKVIIDPEQLSGGAGAEYLYDDTFIFPFAQYGVSQRERATILHECVHCWIDSRGAGHSNRYVDNEAAAYVAETIYLLAASNGLIPSDEESDDLGKVKYRVARKIIASRDAIPQVEHDDARDLETGVLRRMRAAGFKIHRRTPDRSDGIANPLGVLAPVYGISR